jgi:acetyl-CoA carboxylase biotin carboxyl carrier protein
MDLEYLKELLSIFDKSSATEISLEEEGAKIKVSKKEGKVTAIAQPSTQVSMPASATVTQNSQDHGVTAPAVNNDDNLHKITSPIVGTFYAAPSPESPAFVSVGDKVEAGQTLCIVEAMKLMNEIESDVSGTIEKIEIKNAQPVEYGEVLFLIKQD